MYDMSQDRFFHVESEYEVRIQDSICINVISLICAQRNMKYWFSCNTIGSTVETIRYYGIGQSYMYILSLKRVTMIVDLLVLK